MRNCKKDKNEVTTATTAPAHEGKVMLPRSNAEKLTAERLNAAMRMAG